MRLLGPFPPPKKKKGATKPLPLAASDPVDRNDGLFQAVMLGLIALDIGIRFGADVWHRLHPPA